MSLGGSRSSFEKFWPGYKVSVMGEITKVCLQCGLVGNPQAMFCSYCGAELTSFMQQSETSNEATQILSALVPEDTVEAWAKLASELKKRVQSDFTKLSNKYGFVRLDVESLTSPLPAANGQRYCADIDDPWNAVIEIKPGLIMDAWAGCYIVPVGDIPDELQRLYLVTSQEDFSQEDFPCLTYIVISCPRCELILTEQSDDEDFEFERDMAIANCIACSGSGEWLIGD